jgi:arabinogalactan oligomer/maltooligosaccharide transport system permease protein
MAVAGGWGPGFIVKLILMALIDAIGIFGVIQAWRAGSTTILVVAIILLLVVNYVYFARRAIPGKYLVPGMVFLLIFQVYVMLYTAYVSITNYGDQHMGSKDAAITAIQSQHTAVAPDKDPYAIVVLQKGTDYYLATVVDGEAEYGTSDQPLEALDGATITDGKITAVDGYDIVKPDRDNWDTLQTLAVPLSDDASQGFLMTERNGTQAKVYLPTVRYDKAADTFTDTETGLVYHDGGKGQFVDDAGKKMPGSVGWRAVIGFANYKTIFADTKMMVPLLKVLVWTICFAFLSVATTFFLGLILALVFNSPRIKGQKIYRTLMILPYAFPGFMTALLWKAMLNRDYGVINKWIFFGAEIDWLGNPWLARLSIILVNLWLGYPYMFLVCTGSLQSIPSEMMESARVDGAPPLRQFRSITLPLLFIAVAPLLISSFAFNFNNFNLIFMLTGGGPLPGTGSDTKIPGATDILISEVYRLAGVDLGTPDYGLATALSILIFVLVGAIAAFSFRQTRKLEEMA